MEWSYQKDGLHLPEDTHTCKKCKDKWMAEYDDDEEIICPYCGEKQ